VLLSWTCACAGCVLPVVFLGSLACRSSPLFMSLLDRMAFDQQDECLCQSEDLAQDCMLREPLGQTHAEYFAKSLALALRVLSLVAFLGEGWAWGHFPHTCFQVLGHIHCFSLGPIGHPMGKCGGSVATQCVFAFLPRRCGP
jgi:hypothetical protein